MCGSYRMKPKSQLAGPSELCNIAKAPPHYLVSNVGMFLSSHTLAMLMVICCLICFLASGAGPDRLRNFANTYANSHGSSWVWQHFLSDASFVAVLSAFFMHSLLSEATLKWNSTIAKLYLCPFNIRTAILVNIVNISCSVTTIFLFKV